MGLVLACTAASACGGGAGALGAACGAPADCRVGLTCDPDDGVCVVADEAGPRTDGSVTPGSDAASDAAASCGDGFAGLGEECDGADLLGFACWDLGFPGGTLSCALDCRFDTTGCVPLPVGAAAPHDLNGDGYADFAVGAPFDDAGGVDSGAVYVFFGGASLPVAPVAVLVGVAGDQFGLAVSTLGDLDGDGYADVVVGAPDADTSAPNPGAVFVYLGGPGPAFDETADFVLTVAGSHSLGSSVTTAGDYNGDGYADLATGDPFVSVGLGSGSVAVHFGGPSGPLAAPTALLPTPPGAWFIGTFGDAVGAGDLDDDGYDDLVVGAPCSEVGSYFDVGSVYVYRGAWGGSLEPSPDVSLDGVASNDSFGRAVPARADLDGDGIDDLLVGAWAAAEGVVNAGSAYLFAGGAAGPATAPALALADGAATGDLFGAAATTGDLDGDAFADVVVGAPLFGGSAGRAWVYLGGPALDATPDLVLAGSGTQENFAAHLAYAGDIDGDGFGDLLIGASSNGDVAPWSGAVYLFRGGPPPGGLDDVADAVYDGAAGGDSFGYAVGP